jgi:hypothetical protein
MAFPGLGFRTVWSVMLEMSFELVEPTLYSTTASAVVSPGSATIQVNSLGYPVSAVYVGAQLLIDANLSQEVIEVSAFDPTAAPPTITATFALPHASGVQLIGATFPTQAMSGDYFYSQSEILSYLARAQNVFLSDVPLVFAINTQTVQYGQTIQPFPCDVVEAHRIASSYQNVALASLTRLNNVVTAVSLSPHGLIPSEKFAIIQAPDPTFDGSFNVATVPDNLHWTYPQVGPNATVSGGGMAGLWLRLLECSQEELAMQNPMYANNFVTNLKAWSEDRAGLYQWMVAGRPSSNFPCEILCSIRDTDVLQMGDGFLVPDVFLHFVRYLALSYALTKDGEMSDPSRAKYCLERYKRGVMAAKRWLGWAGGLGGKSEQQMQMAGAGQGRR